LHRPYTPEQIDAGIKAANVRNEGHEWWGYAAGKGAYLDRIEWVDYGTDLSSTAAGVASDEIDMIYETISDSVDAIDGLGWNARRLHRLRRSLARPSLPKSMQKSLTRTARA
jgi:peptide/nickel transport system substrate-binding protein